jgi:hypothetical protein
MHLGFSSVTGRGLCRSVPGVFFVFAGLALALSCGGGPAAVPTPTPSSTSVPTTVPAAEPTAASVSCHLGEGDPSAACSRTIPTMSKDVQRAIDLLVLEHPEIFDLTVENGVGTRQFLVKDNKAYYAGVLANLRNAGFCADYAPDLEKIELKYTNDYSETYAIQLSGGYVRRDAGYYRETCTPAEFPVSHPDVPPIGSGCGKPYPPGLQRFGVKVNVKGKDYSVLDSTPQVVNSVYCASIGFTDGRTICPLRTVGAPDREACENWRTGIAKDTGRPGPTWAKEDGGYCTGPESGCQNDPANQYELLVYNNGVGWYTVCSEWGVCGTVYVDR